MNLQSTDFELFGLPPRFALDRAALDERWRELQRQVHPDRFAAEGAAAQRVAMQWSARVNEAYRRLREPLARAAYLCGLNGADVQAERNTAMSPEFLMQQMELREALEDAATPQDLDEIDRLSASMHREALQKLEQQIDAESNWPQAAQTVRALMFLDKLAHDIDRRRERLG
ncbi:MAG: Fe-S protein assembly co-chaperone HscB [Proteobacteria bacterium]|mgnify:CR=1 FL=1|jgi:molecular chaperone HscB|nr:Fe-S protein assembly co-chaperone HscB [Pseudomonadota bacterium]